MGYLGKILIGAVIGVGAIAAAPFTGGGSVLAGASLATSLTGAGLAATGAGLAGAAGGAIVQGVQDLDKEEQIKTAKTAAFTDGVYEGKAATATEIKKYTDFYLATTALSYYIARCDGNISEDEQLEIDFDLDAIKKNLDIPEAVIAEIKKISENTSLTFEDVKFYLDKVSLQTLTQLDSDIDEIIEASDGISEEEIEAKQNFINYLNERRKNE